MIIIFGLQWDGFDKKKSCFLILAEEKEKYGAKKLFMPV